ncbi:uncharacterized protein EV422DRAFT_151446 [Fimicolochytrium jonesii]|uniref:uncharacterized protein n=1 Tax=Fimicolochytrium jonesii TaxID=1396493 RepID=UPI0022FF2110|nr:uncharacterized protein EV422DRAFT_151446 [Fimicolochytrium jonesii]KAI8826052.1 hypothetical protein EV422DRAFT_151446 [Fimicolochytrium jonesii]
MRRRAEVIAASPVTTQLARVGSALAVVAGKGNWNTAPMKVILNGQHERTAVLPPSVQGRKAMRTAVERLVDLDVEEERIVDVYVRMPPGKEGFNTAPTIFTLYTREQIKDGSILFSFTTSNLHAHEEFVEQNLPEFLAAVAGTGTHTASEHG